MGMNPRLLRPTPSGFDPRKISGLALWVDFADLSTLFQNSDGTLPAAATNDPIGYVADKSGNGRHFTQSVNNARPLLELNSQSGRPAALFDGSNDGLTGNSSALNICRNVAGFSAFAVRRYSVTDATQIPFMATTGNHASQSRFSLRTGGSPFAAITGARRIDGDAGTFAVGVTITTIPTIQYGQVDYANGGTGSVLVRVNGQTDGTAALSGTGNTSNTDSQLVSIGAVGESFVNGRICEVLAYPRVLTIGEVQTIERYLAGKWGVVLA